MVAVKNFIFYLLGIVPKLFLKKYPTNQNNYLFVLLSNPLGDFVSRLNFFSSINLEEEIPQVYLALDKKFEELKHLLDSRIKLIFIESGSYKFNPFHKYLVLNQLNQIGFGLTINLSVDRGMFSDEVTVSPNSKHKITIQRKTEFLSNFFLSKNNKKYSQIIDLTPSNEYDKLEVLKKYLNNNYGVKFKTKKEIQQVIIKKDYFVIAPFSSQVIQSWPIENYFDLIDRLKEKSKIIILGNPKNVDRKYYNYENPNVENLISKTNLKEADRIIKNASLFIGNDSGLAHLAYFHKIPLVAIIGGGNYGQFFPHGNAAANRFLFNKIDCFNCRWKCKHNEPFCLTNVTVDSVLDNINEVLHA